MHHSVFIKFHHAPQVAVCSMVPGMLLGTQCHLTLRAMLHGKCFWSDYELHYSNHDIKIHYDNSFSFWGEHASPLLLSLILLFDQLYSVYKTEQNWKKL